MNISFRKKCFCINHKLYPHYHSMLLIVKTRNNKILIVVCIIASLMPLNVQSIINVKKFGAIGDGKNLDSPAINIAIQSANSYGGDTVIIPAGNYLCGSIHLLSNVNLLIDKGATIVADKWSNTSFDPTEPFTPPAYQDGGHTFFHNSLIWGENLSNVTISGEGMIDGSGLTTWQGELNTKMGWINGVPGIPAVPMEPTYAANKAIALKLCTKVEIRDITIFKGGWFGILATGCDNLLIDNVTIDTNRDGIDVDCCTNTVISNCSVNSPNDDGICPKSTFVLGRKVITENLLITNCKVSGYKVGTLLDGTLEPVTGGVGRIKFGTESNGGFRNCTVSNCIFTECRGFAIECVDGGVLDNIIADGLTMNNLNRYGIYVTLGSRLRDPNPGVSTGGNISISNVIGTMKDSINCVQLFGTPDTMLINISLKNINFQLKGGGTRSQSNNSFPELGDNYPDPTTRMLPAYGVYARHIKNLELINFTLNYSQTEFRPAVFCSDVDSVSFANFKALANSHAPVAQFENTRNIYTSQSEAIDTGYVAMNQGNWQLYRKGRIFELFNLTNDKECTINVDAANASVLANLKTKFKSMFIPYKGTETAIEKVTLKEINFHINSVSKTLTIHDCPGAFVSIFDFSGKAIFAKKYEEAIRLDSFATGSYMLRIQSDNFQSVIFKFVI